VGKLRKKKEIKYSNAKINGAGRDPQIMPGAQRPQRASQRNKTPLVRDEKLRLDACWIIRSPSWGRRKRVGPKDYQGEKEKIKGGLKSVKKRAKKQGQKQ